jgi:hypothetical protein
VNDAGFKHHQTARYTGQFDLIMTKHRRMYKIIIVALILTGCAGTNDSVEFVSDEENNKIRVYVEGEHFTNFFYPDDMEKPALYPIFTASGLEITRGYPYNPRSFERIDHPHHVGLWFNFGDVNGLDFWNNSFAVNPENKYRYGSIVFDEVISKNPSQGELVVKSSWVDIENTPLISEETTFIFGGQDGLRTIKRTSKLTAVQDVQMRGNKEGLLGLRVDRAFEAPANSPQRLLDAEANVIEERTLNNEGINGAYRNADGQEGGEVWGQRSPWVALTAEKEGETVTISIFDHADNPYYPAWSHARGYGLFAVNNLGGRDMFEDAEDVDVQLSEGESIAFTHLVVIGGEMTDEELNGILEEFNN